MAMPSEEQIERMQKNAESLSKLPNEKLIMLALAELVSVEDRIGPGKRVPLASALEERGGAKSMLRRLADGS